MTAVHDNIELFEPIKINKNFKHYFSQEDLDYGIEQTNNEILNLLNFTKEHRHQIANLPSALLPKKPKIAFRFFQKVCAAKVPDKIHKIGHFI